MRIAVLNENTIGVLEMRLSILLLRIGEGEGEGEGRKGGWLGGWRARKGRDHRKVY